MINIQLYFYLSYLDTVFLRGFKLAHNVVRSL